MRKPKNPVIKPEEAKQMEKAKRIEVTLENAPKLSVHFLEKIYGRLGYIIKLLEKKHG